MAMGANVGQVYLDLMLQSKQFKTQLNSAVSSAVKDTTTKTQKTVTSSFAKMGKAAIAAFSIGAIAKFTKDCLQLGSDLAEVQNVVDVTFGNMSEDINEFSKSAIKNIGISETLCKRYTGTIGAMAKSFGFTTEEAATMAKTLTTLTGDVSSFYNMNADEAFTKLKAVFTGETEALKEIGVVMTQAALDQFALANGYGKTTAKMTEQEKVALRYAFVQDKLKTATGDFIRTQNGWANQTRILSLQFDSLKANLGQGLINALTPVIKLINILMEKLVQLAGSFSSFTARLFGKQSTGSSPISTAVSDMAELDASTASVGDTTANTAKQIKKSLMGFDKLNTLNDNSSTGSGGGGGGGISPGNIDLGGNSEVGAIGGGLATIEEKFGKVIQRAQELAGLFKKGFFINFDPSKVDIIKNNLESIGKTASSIFTRDDVKNAANDAVNQWATTLGSFTGMVASIGTSIGINLTGGISQALSSNASRISDWLVNMFDISERVGETSQRLFEGITTIFTSLESPVAQELTGNIISIFGTVVGFISQFFGNLGADMFALFVDPLSENAEQIKLTIEGLLEPITTVSEGIKNAFQSISDKWMQVYNEQISPVISGFKDDFTDLVEQFLEYWNTYIKPVLDNIGTKVSEIFTNYISPVFESVGELIGELALLIKGLWDEYLKPIIEWISSVLFPIVSNIATKIWNVVEPVIKWICTSIKTVVDVFKNVIQIIRGLITGDWSAVWEGAKGIFTSIWDGVKNKFSIIVDSIKTKFTGLKDSISNTMTALKNGIKGPLNSIIRAINKLIGGLNGIKINIPDWVPGMGGKSYSINIPKIPELAQGGYVKPNSPQLAIIGDNKREGEIVAPESKIRESVRTELSPILSSIRSLLEMLANANNGGDITIPIYLDGNQLDRVIINANNRQALRTGGR